MNVINLLLIIIAALNFFLALVLFFRTHKNLTYFFFVLVVFSGAAWSLSIALFRMSPDVATALLWDKIIYVTGSLVPVAFLYFCYSFTKKSPPPFLYGLFCWLIPAFLIATLILTNLWIVKIDFSYEQTSVVLGPIYIGWVIYFMAFMAYGTFLLWRQYQRGVGLEKAQLGYILLAILFPMIGAIPFNLVMPIFGNYRLIFIGPFFLSLMILVITYAIIRHRLFDIRFAIQQFISYTIQTTLIGIIFAVTAGLYWYLSGNSPRPSVLIFIIIASALLTLILDKLQSLSQFISRQFFFQSVYDYQKTLQDLSLHLAAYLEMPKLIDILAGVLVKTMRLSKVAVLIKDFSDGSYKIQQARGFDEVESMILVQDNFLIKYLGSHPQIIVLEEINQLAGEADNDYDRERLWQLFNHMTRIEAALIIPIASFNEVISLLVLGNKISRDIYTVQDIRLLYTVASQAAIAIENARLYQQVTDLNQNLQQKIYQATAELHKRNIDLEKAYQDLKILDKLKDEFISVVSHELRTPMTAIRSYAWMAANKPDVNLSEKMKKYLSRILISTERLINLVNDMLNVSRIEAGKLEIKPSVFDIQALVNDVSDEVSVRAKEKMINITVQSTQVPKVFADPDKVRQVLVNIITNSLKFTSTGGAITISFFSDGTMVEVTVKDSGVGISRDDLSRLFQKFGRLDNSYVAAATVGGTGLGLYISKSLIELMHGRIWAQSEGLGQGSTFTFSLPIASQQVLSQAEKYTKQAVGEAKGLEPVVI